MKAVVLIRVRSNKPEILKELREIKEIKKIYVVYGGYDFILVTEVNGPKQLSDLIHQRLHKIPDLHSTQTLIVIK